MLHQPSPPEGRLSSPPPPKGHAPFPPPAIAFQAPARRPDASSPSVAAHLRDDGQRLASSSSPSDASRVRFPLAPSEKLRFTAAERYRENAGDAEAEAVEAALRADPSFAASFTLPGEMRARTRAEDLFDTARFPAAELVAILVFLMLGAMLGFVLGLAC